MNADKVHAGVKIAFADMAERGWQAENFFISPNETAVPTVERCLAKSRYDCVVIGAGVRPPPSRLILFEALVDAIHRAAPSAAIAFNTRPETPARRRRAGSERPQPARTTFVASSARSDSPWWPQRDTNPFVLWNSAELYGPPSSTWPRLSSRAPGPRDIACTGSDGVVA